MKKIGVVGVGLVGSCFTDLDDFEVVHHHEVVPAHSLNLSLAVMTDTSKAKDLGLLPTSPR